MWLGQNTSSTGLRTHQGREKCLKVVGQGPGIDPYFLQSKWSQSSEVQQQDEHQSQLDINPPVLEEEEESSTEEPHEPRLPQPATDSNQGAKVAKILSKKGVGNSQRRHQQTLEANEGNCSEETGANGRTDLQLRN